MPNEWNEVGREAVKIAPGAIGSLVSLLFLKEESKTRRWGSFFAGAAISYYFTPWLTRFTDMPPGLTGFLAGLTGLLLVSKVMDMINRLDLLSIATDWIRSWLRIDPKKKGR